MRKRRLLCRQHVVGACKSKPVLLHHNATICRCISLCVACARSIHQPGTCESFVARLAARIVLSAIACCSAGAPNTLAERSAYAHVS